MKKLDGSCPVIKGEMWLATKWIHVGPYVSSKEAGLQTKVVQQVYVPSPPPDVDGCVDHFEHCDMWALGGDCVDTVSVPFMIGESNKKGHCLKACARCDLGPNAIPDNENIEQVRARKVEMKQFM
eukprot:gene23223-30443_t